MGALAGHSKALLYSTSASFSWPISLRQFAKLLTERQCGRMLGTESALLGLQSSPVEHFCIFQLAHLALRQFAKLLTEPNVEGCSAPRVRSLGLQSSPVEHFCIFQLAASLEAPCQIVD